MPVWPGRQGWTFVIGALLVGATMLQAQEVFTKVRYKGGHPSFGDVEIRGVLVLEDSTLTFIEGNDENPCPPAARGERVPCKKASAPDPDGRRLVIPLASVTEIGSQTQRKEASVGSKLLFGGLARSRQEEFIAISYDLPDNAEAVVFRFEPNTSASALAKIKFRMRKLGVTPPAATDPGTAVTPAP